MDAPIPEDDDKSSAAPAPGAVVSYGPASRRRLSSMQSMRGQHPEPLINQAQANAMKKFPLFPKSSTSPMQTPMTKSPDQIPGTESISPKTVSEAEGWAEDQPSGISAWARRLDEIEKRQERMEELLIQIAKDVKRD